MTERKPSIKPKTSASRAVTVDESPATVLAVLRILRRGWPILLVATIVMTAIAIGYTKTLPRIYESEALIEFDPDVVRPLADKTDEYRAMATAWDNHEYYETQYKIMVSDRVLSAVVRDLGLQTDAKFVGPNAHGMLPLDLATDMLRAKTRVDPVKNTRLTNIRVEDQDPKFAQKLADGISQTYVSQNLEKSVSGTGDAVVWLNGQLDHFRGELESNENALHEFKKKNDLPSSSLDEVSKQIRNEMQQYDEALTTTRTRKEQLLARRNELARVNAANPDEVPASELLGNVFMSNLRQQYQAAMRDKRELAAEGKGDNHPLMLKAKERIDETSRELIAEVRTSQDAVERDLAVIGREESGEARLYEEAKRKAVDLNLKELEYHRLDRFRAENEKVYDALLEQTKNADLARMMNVNNVRVVDPASDPKGPIRPRTDLNALVGMGAGLLFGFGLVFLREQADSSLKSPIDVEQRLGVTFLGMIPEVDPKDGSPATRKSKLPRRLSQLGTELPTELIVHERPLSAVAEAARTIRTNLMFMNPDQPYRALLVTSAAPAEGKTTVACSIAISLAQSGQRTCIVDCDLRRPRLHRIFGRPADNGLTNILVNEATLDDVAQPTVVDNLWCVPAGPIPPNPGDVLHSERFKALLRDLQTRFDRVVLDSPPLVAVTDSAIISTLVDGVVFVVRAFATSRTTSRQGLRALSDVDATVAGAVLNAVDLRKNDTSYYQYYQYKREGYPSLTPSEQEKRDAEG